MGNIKLAAAVHKPRPWTVPRPYRESLLSWTGDQPTRVEVLSGNDVTVVVPSTGLVIHDVGVKSFDIDDNVLFAHDPHDVLEDFDAASGW